MTDKQTREHPVLRDAQRERILEERRQQASQARDRIERTDAGRRFVERVERLGKAA